MALPARRTVADLVAFVLFVLLVICLVPSALKAPVPTGTVAPAPPQDGQSAGAPARPRPTPSTRPTPAATEAAPAKAPSVWERVLDPSTVRLLRVLLIIGGAFVLAAMVQRAIMGRFGFEAFGLKLDQLEATKEGFDDVTAEIEKLRAETSESLEAVVEELGGAVTDLSDAIDAVAERVDGVEAAQGEVGGTAP